MRCSARSKGVFLLTVLLVHTALGSPVVKRDVRLFLGNDGVAYAVAEPDHQVSLYEADVFGGEAHENGLRDKRTLKLKALGLGVAAKAVGAGVKAVGTGVKTVAVAGAKTVGKAALKVATTVGVKVAKAAITIGIAKLLLNLVFGTRLLGNAGAGKGILSSSNLGALSSSSGSSSSSSGGSSSGGGGGGGDTGSSFDGETTESSAADSGIGELPDIDPQKISLQVPNEIVSGGFNVVNRAAPLVGEVIQRTAERLVGIGSSLKPLFAVSLGVGPGTNLKRDADNENNEDEDEQDDDSTNHVLVTADPPSQFKRSPPEEPPQQPNESASALLAKKVIERLKEKRDEREVPTITEVEPSQTIPENPYFSQQIRNYNPHVKRQAPHHEYLQYQQYQHMPRYLRQ